MSSEGASDHDSRGGSIDPLPPAEHSVTLEQLHHLLGYGHEMQTLDYKQSCDIDDRRAEVELAKDVAAMQIEGGWIVIGADDAGVPVPPGVPDRDRKKFDEASLRPKLARYLPEPFELHTALHTIGDCTLALIHVVPRPDGFCIFAKDGTYQSDGRTKTVFRHGEVFVRHGTTNERWKQSDIDQIRKHMVSTMKEAWWAEREEDQRHREAVAQRTQRVVSGPLTSFTWRIDAETFDAATLELFRATDDIPLRRVLNEAVANANTMIESGEIDELATVVGRVVSIAAQAITYKRPEWFNEALDALVRIYSLGFEQHGLARNDGKAPDIWLVVLEHVLALGALAARKRDWDTVAQLAVTPPGGDSDFYASWLRHALTMAARSKRLDDGKSLVTRSAERIAELPALRPDITPEDQRVISSICQFDILAVLAIIAATQDSGGGGWYPNFARFYTVRSEPAVEQLIQDPDMRAAIFPLSNTDLATALREVDRMSRNEGAQYTGWNGFNSVTVEQFLKDNPA